MLTSRSPGGGALVPGAGQYKRRLSVLEKSNYIITTSGRIFYIHQNALKQLIWICEERPELVAKKDHSTFYSAVNERKADKGN
jgi:hypothetical protein